ncbi:hypothetical protein [Nonomuraea sp. KM90]|uniref:hypothetical protein n=1 Tax=Nonomuraea sp. KM90 TaxID=3457428 RepID=UPI003FCCBDE2
MRCAHAEAVPVESVVTGEVLAALCPDCDAQLPAEFLACPHEDVIETPCLCHPPGLGICNGCGTSAWFDRPQMVISFGKDVDAERLAEFEARFRAAQREPYRTLFLPYVASISVPTPIELEIR